jgi:hypothetical protein
MFISRVLPVLPLMLLIPLSISAQTSSELHQKYKSTSAVESFEVRPGLIATVFYSEDGQPVEVSIKSRLFYTSNVAQTEMPLSIFEEVVAEFAPVAKRGKLCNETDSESGRNHYVHTTYENVSIYSALHNRGQDNATASMAHIRWKKMSCPNPK